MIPLTKFLGNISKRKFLVTKGFILLISLFIFLIILTILAEKYEIDLVLSSTFFSLEEDWYLGDKNPWKWLYDYGTMPGILVSIISFSLLVIYRKNTKLSLLRPYLLICGFTPIIASLIFVNIVLKDHTGRPRPREISKFNGNWNYKPVFKLGIPGKGHSFPCGHCSIAFTLISGIVFFRRNPKFALLSFSAGLIYGILMSIARIVQGGHFLSDTIWSLGIVLSTIIVLYYFIFQPPINEKKNILFLTKGQKLKIVSFNTITLILLIVFVFTRRPFFTGLIYGVLMSIARIVQGGHFLSDTIWSLGLVLSTIIVLYYFIFQPPINEKKHVFFLTKKQKVKIVSFNTIALILLIVFVFTRRPFFKDHVRKFEINNDIKLLELHVPNNWNLSPNFIDKINSGSYLLEVKGYAPPYTTHYLSFVPKINGNKMKLEFNENIVGYKRDFIHHLDLTLPARFNGNLEVYKNNSKEIF